LVDAQREAERLALRFPETLFYVTEAVSVSVAPRPAVETFRLSPFKARA
jgi:hypothetical protein